MATKKLISLTEEDVKLLQRLLDLAKDASPSLRSAFDSLWSYGEDQSAPEVYIAKPNNGTIPAMTVAGGVIGTGTGTSPTCDAYDSPGSATCRVYEIIDTEDCGPALMEVEDHDETVYNLTETAINTGNDYIPVLRDKFGKWLAQVLSGASIDLAFVCFGTFSRGSSVSCTVMLSITGSSVSAGDTITASDYFGEYYNSSGAGGGCVVKFGGSWYFIRATCYNFDASAVCAGTGTAS